jgi:cell division protein FtsZ
MVFVTTGLGAAAPAPAAPVIASTATAGALTIAVVNAVQVQARSARAGRNRAQSLREAVDTVITIPNERLLAVIDRHTSMLDAFVTATMC